MKPPDDPREWLNRARSNLSRSRMRSPDVYLEDSCFDAQQAAEKAIKAVMITMGVEFPYTHDLTRLLSLLEDAGTNAPDAVLQAGVLTEYATVTRYPGAYESVSEEEYANAVRMAEVVVVWAEGIVRISGR